jgi:CheY-like chemotaxis protein
VSPKVIDLNETVDGMLKMLRRLIGEQITLVWKPGAALKSVLMDPSQVDQILANLCVNARDATDGAGEVLISTSNVQMELGEVPSGEYILLKVKDDGHGIEKETLEHLFEPFFTTKAPGGGTGLGLATVYGIVKQNGGHIRVTSEASQGTEFRIYLPAVDGKMKGTKDSKSEEKLRGGDTILLVEDEPALLKLGRRMLEALGYRVLAAPGPYEALDIADREEGIDLLVTDVIMPRMNGRELMNSLKRIHPELRVLYISGYTAEVIANQGVLEEDVHFLQKPFSMNALSRALAEALGKV